MYYTTNQVQNASADFENCLVIPSMLTDFVNTGTSVEATKGGKEAYCFHGDLYFDNDDYRCPDCNCRMHIHFQWFAKLLDSHFEGIIAHASLPISSGKMEGINNKIKTLRRQAYGFPDDEYFFLKLIDSSRRGYVRNPVSHKLFH